jgi:lipoate-protein ligase A
LLLRINCLESADPYEHLAIEHHYLYQDSDIETSPVLLIYRNRPSVIFGNFQNPWKECDVAYCMQNNISLVRRFTGGGCVYHDLGNLNFCLVTSKKLKNDKLLTNFIISFLNFHNIPVIEGEKSDLLLHHQKISGSAFRLTKDKMIHHCTLLFNSDLGELSRVLSSKLSDTAIKTKALGSRRAKVSDLKNYKWNSIEEFISDFCIFIQGKISKEKITIDSSVWKSWEQIWGKTPNFSLIFDELECEIKSGILTQIQLRGATPLKLEYRLPLSMTDLVDDNLNEIFKIQKYKNWLWQIGLVN